MAKKSKKLSFKKFVLLYKYTDSAVGDLARDILYDENFPFRASISNQKQYLEEQSFVNLDIFDELVNHYQNQESISPPLIDPKYRKLFQQIERLGKKCLEKDERDTIRTLWVENQLYSPYSDSIIQVTAHPNRQAHKDVLEVYAHYFRREFRYDFVQFSASEESIKYNYTTQKYERNDFVGWLFTCSENSYRDSIGMVKTVGGCCFRYREYSNAPPGWALCWIWLHPYYRQRGILSKNWKLFQQEFGQNFDVEPPFSKAMASFLSKVGYETDERLI